MSTLEQSLKALEERLEARYQGLVLMTNLLSGGDEYEPPIVRVMTVQIPPDSRKQGLGSEVMSQIISWADDHGVMLSLSPSTDFGASSVSRLTKFYRRFGFKPNKGRNKDFRTRDTMLRNPSLRKSSATYEMPRKWDKEHCESKPCDEMGFSEKASCRPYVDCYGGKKGVKSSHLISRVASRYLESAKRDDPKMKNTGHGGLDTWFAGHGGGKPDDRATWGDWIAVTPVKHTIKKDNGDTKTYEAGDIVGPCGVSSEPSWSRVTDGGKNPLKCMPRDKAHDLTKEQRATLARKKRREESKAKNGQKPVLTPTFSEEGKNMIEKKASQRAIRVAKKYLRG
jgi:GNAT superfamily N-acetyltransferase